jgi:CHASE2 domain-containing sensor protein
MTARIEKAPQRQARARRRAVTVTIALTGALVFGILVLAGGDWIPGTITVIAAVVGIAAQIRELDRLRGERTGRPSISR